MLYSKRKNAPRPESLANWSGRVPAAIYAAANQHYASLDNVEEGNPNWYVYWQQVANQFTHDVSGTFGPQARMIFSSDRPKKIKNGKNVYTLGKYGFKRRAPTISYSISNNPEWEWITIYATCERSIMEYITTIHHENGHRQSHELANEHGGWGPGITYHWRNDVEVEELWAGENANLVTQRQAKDIWKIKADSTHKKFEKNHDDFEPNRNDHEKLMDRHHADPPTATTGLCISNENHVENKKTEINQKDWSFNE